jgi:hypothetical protein
MLAWSQRDDAYAIPQFLHEENLSWVEFRHLVTKTYMIQRTFERCIPRLWGRWFRVAFQEEKLTKTQHAIVMRYIEAYDPHCALMLRQVENQPIPVTSFTVENYAPAKLTTPYQEKFDANADKSGSPTQAESVSAQTVSVAVVESPGLGLQESAGDSAPTSG